MCGPGSQAVQIGFNSMSQGGLLDLRKGLWLWVGGCAERVAGTDNFRQSRTGIFCKRRARARVMAA